MKKLLLLTMLLVLVGSMVALESEPSEVVGYVKYSSADAGYLAVAFPLDDGSLVMASDLGDKIGTASTISQWSGTTWQTASKLPMGWAGDYTLTPGMPYMVNSSAAADVYVAGSVPTQINHTFTSGQYTFMMLRMDRSDLAMAGALGDEIGVCSSISNWSGTTWQTASKLPMGWGGNFAIGIGDPLMVNANGNGVWPALDAKTKQQIESVTEKRIKK